MKLKFRKHTSSKQISRMTRKIRIRKTVTGTSERPRLCIYKSGRHIYAQLINDEIGSTLLATSSLEVKLDKPAKEIAEAVGKDIAKKDQEKNISSVVFDRNGFIYHGRVKSLADGARAGGLKF